MKLHISKSPLQRFPFKPRKLGTTPDKNEHNPVSEGLNLIDFAIVPHYRSPHPEAAAAERCARYFAAQKRPFRALRDGEAIVWTGARAAATAELRRIA